MQRRDDSRSASHRRPRLMRACATEPSIMTASAASHAVSSAADGCVSASTSPHGYRRATDLLNHVAYLSSAAASAAASYATSPLSPRRAPLQHAATATAATAVGMSLASASRHIGRNDGAGRRSSDGEDVLGSSPASTTTGSSLDDDLHGHHLYSANYFSFPSFDTWDPDCQDKGDEDGRVP